MYIIHKHFRGMNTLPTLHPNPRTLTRTGRKDKRMNPDYITIVTNRYSMPEAPVKPSTATPVLNLRFESMYRILLHYSKWTEDDTKRISQKVKFSVPILTLRDCEQIVKHARSYGMSIVCTITQDKAELYKDALVQAGLNATLEEA